ncbi:MAG: pentapeptide repeat protein [Acidobacteria bacterium]|nr:pentapeptide repeat protein [Acidobacteriota bacterium]
MKALVTALALLLLVAAEGVAQAVCPAPTGKDFSGQNLTDHNFSGQKLQGANFTKAVLDGAQFANADLTGAIFPGASLTPSAKGRADFTGATLIKSCFAGAVLRQTDFQFARLACSDFSRSDVTQVNFGPRPDFDPAGNGCGRAKFVDATIRVQQIPFGLWRFTDFTRTRFLGLTTETFQGSDISGALLAEAHLAGFDFRKATLTDVDLTHADLRGAVFDGAKAHGITLDGADFQLGIAEGAETDFTAASLRGLIAQNAELSGALLASAVLRGANLAGADLRGANLKGATLESGDGLGPAELSGANLSGAILDDAHLNFVSFGQTRLIGTSFTRVTLADTDFSNAVMPGVNFFGATLEGVSFRGSPLENASFARARLRRSQTSGRGVDLGCTQLGGANLRDLDEAPLGGAVTFLGAVLPDAAECRTTGKDVYCGTDPAGQRPYGPTLLPVLAHPATCPNGELEICSGKTWLLHQWKTNVCGLPETRWTPPPPVPPPPGETVNIPDANFRTCLSRQFFGDDRPIPTDYAATVEEINCASRNIADVTGLEAFTALQKLTLTANALTDGEIFGRLKNLQILQISSNRLTTLNIRLPTLKALNAANNAIQRVTGLETADLEYLDLSHNQLTTFALDSQRQLFYADLSHNALTSVGELSHGFDALSYLYLQNNDLTAIGSLADAPLTYLRLGSNPRFQCQTLKVSKEILEASNCGKP